MTLVRCIRDEAAVLPPGWAVYRYDGVRCEAWAAPLGVAHLLRLWHWGVGALRRSATPAPPPTIHACDCEIAFQAGLAEGRRRGREQAVAQMRAIAPSVTVRAGEDETSAFVRDAVNALMEQAVLVAADRVEQMEQTW